MFLNMFRHLGLFITVRFSQLIFYGRKFTLTNCNESTKHFLTQMGVAVGRGSEIPLDENVVRRMEEAKNMKPGRPYEKIDSFGQFLEHDRVLCFDAYWDDTDTEFGDVHNMILHYYLADDTIEVREVFRPNDGRDANSVFLHRGKLHRMTVPLQLPGKKTPRTVLNVCRQHHILDSLKTGALNEVMNKVPNH